MTDRCRCGVTAQDRKATAACYIAGCPYPEIARPPIKPRERDLRHGAPDARFGAAVMACEGFTPDCSHHGRCMNDGLCFANAPQLVAARMIEKLLPESRNAIGMHLAYVRRVAEMLRAGDIQL